LLDRIKLKKNKPVVVQIQTKSDKVGQSRTKLDKVGQSRTKSDKVGQSRTNSERATGEGQRSNFAAEKVTKATRNVTYPFFNYPLTSCDCSAEKNVIFDALPLEDVPPV
jgi:hypothetical protein